MDHENRRFHNLRTLGRCKSHSQVENQVQSKSVQALGLRSATARVSLLSHCSSQLLLFLRGIPTTEFLGDRSQGPWNVAQTERVSDIDLEFCKGRNIITEVFSNVLACAKHIRSYFAGLPRR